ncbi:nicotinamidase [Coniella lustricola]|uniref:nicotinamidase n=1 Tax=Coniella lustricola TaxID=2025994 RepID=A0A2T3AGF0_9PEZI|nr:nicotinamidase [Coniella lustricola]
MTSRDFVPALIIVDVQEDFCPPKGSLAVPNGRSIAEPINSLLAEPKFALRIATQDWHPANHISFANNHNPPKQPFTDSIKISNPLNPSEEPYTTRLWPVHCVQDTAGAALIPELDTSNIDVVVKKGQDSRVEMYSAFYDPFRQPTVSDSGLADTLKERGITHVYVVGLAYDYCVKATAVDAAKEGFVVYVVQDGTKAVGGNEAWEECTKSLEADGVKVVRMEDEEVQRLR